MRVCKCEKGHYFDADRYDICPHCGAAAAGQRGESSVAEHYSSPVQTAVMTSMPVVNGSKFCPNCGARSYDESSLFCIECGTRLQMLPDEEAYSGSTGDSDETVFLPVSHIEKEPESEQSVSAFEEIRIDPVSKPEPVLVSEEEKTDKTIQPDSPIDTDIIQKNKALQEAISEAAGDSDRTIGFFGRPGKIPAPEAASARDEEPEFEPVSGWLVCIKGPHAGRYFDVYSGRNSIGRLSSNRIVLSKDPKVSREKHAAVIYEPKNRKFYAQPGDGSGITYLNDVMLTEVKPIGRSDRLEIGDSVFLLVPLCGPDFTWEDYL